MKLNNKGFAISTIMYMILIMAVVLITLSLTLLSSRKLVLDKIKDEAKDNIYNVSKTSYRKVLETLKSEAESYLQLNESVKISELNSSVSNQVLTEYKLIDKYLVKDETGSISLKNE